MIRFVVAAAAMVLAVAAMLLAIAYLAQRRLLFPAPPGSPPVPSGGVEIVRLDMSFGVVEALLLLPVEPSPKPVPLLLFAHGNGELADYWVDEFGPPRASGWAVLLLEYPGYGRSAGRPSEGAVRAVANAAFEWARRDPRFDMRHIVAYGRSLGGAVAAGLAADRNLPGLILESAFTSVRPFAAEVHVPAFLVRDPFDTLAALKAYRGRVLVLHGRNDTIVPIAHGRTLAAAVAGSAFFELACGHNDCPRPWDRIEPFLRQLVVA
jgi:fermentation-respiration switch protein FrsA (DUF1100 family)